jgi:hypothetical protein
MKRYGGLPLEITGVMLIRSRLHTRTSLATCHLIIYYIYINFFLLLEHKLEKSYRCSTGGVEDVKSFAVHYFINFTCF